METLEALNDLIRMGKVRILGASNTAAWQFSKALYKAGERGWSNEESPQLLFWEEERQMLPLCADQGTGGLPWSPLARGQLAQPWSEVGETDNRQ